MTRDEFNELMQRLYVVYPKRFNKGINDILYERYQNITKELFRRVVNYILDYCDYPPTIASFRKAYRDVSQQWKEEKLEKLCPYCKGTGVDTTSWVYYRWIPRNQYFKDYPRCKNCRPKSILTPEEKAQFEYITKEEYEKAISARAEGSISPNRKSTQSAQPSASALAGKETPLLNKEVEESHINLLSEKKETINNVESLKDSSTSPIFQGTGEQGDEEIPF